jgi:hypothetical protein
VTALDPLLHHLHRRGGGSWSYFSQSVESFDSDLNPSSCARTLAEHALVEFDFSGTRDWSVTSVQFVSSQSGISAWGGTARYLNGPGLRVQPRTAWVDRRFFTYRHGALIHKGGALPRGMSPVAADDILRVLPTVGAMIDAKPVDRVPVRKAERLVVRAEERRNPDGGFRRAVLVPDWEPTERIACDQAAVWRVDRRTHVITHNNRAFAPNAEAALWHGFVKAADRLGLENLAIYDGRDLRILRYPPLPIPYVRALLLADAREIASDRRERRQFTNVSAALVRWLGEKLGFTITDVS